MAPPAIGGSSSDGMTASRYSASSSARIGSGSASGPWPGPVLMTLRGSLNTLCEHGPFLTATLKKASSFAHPRPRSCICQWSLLSQRSHTGRRSWFSLCRGFQQDAPHQVVRVSSEGTTNLAEILRYARDGVRRSAGIEAHSGTMLGALGEPVEWPSTSCTVARVGSILTFCAAEKRKSAIFLTL